MENLISSATKNGWSFLGETRQGQALLALGLPKFLYSLQELDIKELSVALEKRESLLRLVDPLGLGEFRWLSFQRDLPTGEKNQGNLLTNLFLEEPTY